MRSDIEGAPAPSAEQLLDRIRAQDLAAQIRMLDGLLAWLEGWNIDWTDPGEVELLGVPRHSPADMLEILVRALSGGALARIEVDVPPGAGEQLRFQMRRSA
ncbi:MAG TPA: hypothetical protein VGR37_08760 [Longimicrobiaceae bacterium]|nr:hypothetical protein [Longimicrobiaceae bacterium]